MDGKVERQWQYFWVSRSDWPLGSRRQGRQGQNTLIKNIPVGWAFGWNALVIRGQWKDVFHLPGFLVQTGEVRVKWGTTPATEFTVPIHQCSFTRSILTPDDCQQVPPFARKIKRQIMNSLYKSGLTQGKGQTWALRRRKERQYGERYFGPKHPRILLLPG